jgi:hypothetical protein
LHLYVTPALGRLKQEDCEFQAILGYTARPCLKTTTKNKRGEVVLKKDSLSMLSHVYWA